MRRNNVRVRATLIIITLSFGLLSSLQAQDTGRIQAGVRAYHKANAVPIVQELIGWLSLPNDAAKPEDIQRNAVALQMMLDQRGIATEILPIGGGRPVVYGELSVPGASTTLLFYCHYDGQAVDQTKWHSDPYKPVLRDGAPSEPEADWSTIPFPSDGKFGDDWRVYARSASDDKSPIVALLAALDALRSQGTQPRVNLKFIFDGEEEQGSPYLEEFVRANQKKLAADLMIVADGPVHQSGLPTIVFGARGIMTLTLTTYGPTESLHSGHYGNWAPNPGMRLAQLLATMKDADGKVLVEGYYNDVVPLTKTELSAIRQIPAMEPALRERFGIGQSEGAGKSLQELINVPSLNVRGLQSAWVGADARTIVPSTATAEIDVRLVKGTDHQKMFDKIAAHIRKQGWHVVDREPTRKELTEHPRVIQVVKVDGYNAVRTPMDLDAAQAVVRSVERFANGPIVRMPTSGGSVPLYFFEEAGLPSVSVPIVNFDNNQHSPNENLRLGHFFRGIEVFASILLWE
jgi:acetylornithine deacetylase/succinyl-diaminopimelate desuccinylase-like protein